MNGLCYVYDKYWCLTLTAANCANSLFGCCSENDSKCAEIYWVACCPCRCAFGTAFGSLGLICDLCYAPCHCLGNDKWLQCTQEWCGWQSVPDAKHAPEGELCVSPDPDRWYVNAVSLRSYSQLFYYLCCVHNNCYGSRFVKHCGRCEPDASVAAVAPTPAMAPPPALPPARPSVSMASTAPPSAVSLSGVGPAMLRL